MGTNNSCLGGVPSSYGLSLLSLTSSSEPANRCVMQEQQSNSTTTHEHQAGHYRIGEAKKPGPPKKKKKGAKGTRNIRKQAEILIEDCDIPQSQRCSVVGGCRVHRTWWQGCIEQRTQGCHFICQPPWPSIPIENQIQEFNMYITDDYNSWNQTCNNTEVSQNVLTAESDSWNHFSSQNTNSIFSNHLEPPPNTPIGVETNTNNTQTPIMDNIVADIMFFDNLTRSDNRIRLDTNEDNTANSTLETHELPGMQSINNLIQVLHGEQQQPPHNQDQLDVEVTPTQALSPHRDLAPSVAEMSSCSPHTNASTCANDHQRIS